MFFRVKEVRREMEERTEGLEPVLVELLGVIPVISPTIVLICVDMPIYITIDF